MLYTKDGYPEINEIVKCTVKKIYGNTTFVYIDEYEKEGVLTIAEIAPGRIRNLRDHVTENKVIICKVLRVDEKGNRIDVSLRRVPIPVMKDKQEQIKKEEYAEKIYMDAAKELGTNKDYLFENTYEAIFENYETVWEALYDIMLDNTKVGMFDKLSEKERKVLVDEINEKIKPEEVTFKTQFKLRSLDINGINLIKEAIAESLKLLNHDRIDVYYLAAGTFSVNIRHDDMKSASQVFNNFRKELESQSKAKALELQVAQV